MTEHDDKFEAFLAREAAQYHTPPAEVPREAMWETVAAARAAARPGAGPSMGARRASRPTRGLRYAPWIGMAATLLLGVGIGRYALERSPAGGATGLVGPVASAPIGGGPAPAPAPVTGGVGGVPEQRALVRPTDGTADGSAVVATAAPAPRGTTRLASARPVTNGTESGPSTYAVASQQHLTRAEALVAVVAAMPADAMMDSLTGRWARDVLSNTRLLLDSPAGDDPVRRQLLEDLETVLVQLVQRSGRTAEDRAMLDRTLQRTQILTRLRSGAAGT